MSSCLSTIPSYFKKTLPAFQHKNYRLFWFGQTVSMTGTWMQTTAQAWLVYQMTNSPFLLGLIGALQFTPVMLFSLVAGVYLDRFPKKKIIQIAQAISMVLALLLTVLVFSGHIKYWQIAIIVTILGFVNTLDMPTRQSFMMEIVGREHLTSAIALNSVTFNLARIIGPAIGGILMARYGAGPCFLVNTISFIGVLISLYFITVNPNEQPPKSKEKKPVFTEIMAGLKYIRSNPVLFKPLVLLGILATLAVNFNVIVPVFVKTVLHAKAQGFGFLLSALGAGSIIGALTVATSSEKMNKKFLIKYMPFAICAGLILTGISTNIYMAGFFMVLLGIVNLLFFNSVNSTLQLNASPEYRGRVMSVYTLVFGGTTPIGNLFAGYISGQFGGRAGFVLSGVIVLVLIGGLWWLMGRKK